MIADDKENIRPVDVNLIAVRKGFSALLDSAMKEHNHEIDLHVAVQSQCKDITNMVNKVRSDISREERGSKYEA